MAEKFKVLLIGSGGREYAFLRKLLGSPDVEVHVAPGSSGMLYFLNEEERSRVKLYPQIKATDIKAICQLAQEIMPDLVVVGPEDPLILGLADELEAHGFNVFGFSKKAAKLEGSKWFCKEVYQRCGLHTAEAVLLESTASLAFELGRLEKAGQPVIPKCDGAALGKGVVPVPLNRPDYWGEIERVVKQMFDPQKPLGFLAGRVLLEHLYPILNEWSAMHLLGSNGVVVHLMPTKDHKLLDGLNTGGMGIITPAPGFSLEDMESRRGAINIVRAYMRSSENTELCGILYEGLNRMLNRDYLMEINARGGDPETQAQLEFILGVLFHELLLALVEGRPEILQQVRVPENKVLVGVVMASRGYPGPYEKGKPVIIPPNLPAPGLIFPAGLVWQDGKLYTSGGRVLMAVGEGKTVAEARLHAYEIVRSIESYGALVWRTDIGEAA